MLNLSRHQVRRGFSLAELFVVIAICGVIMAIVAEVINAFSDQSSAQSLVISQDGHRAAAVFSDGTVQAWDITQRRRLFGIERTGQLSFGDSIAMSPDGKRLAHARIQSPPDLFLDLWNLETRTRERRWNKAITQVEFSPDGQALACADMSGTIEVLDCAEGTIRHSFTTPGGATFTSKIAFSPDGKSLTAIDTSNLTIWDLPSNSVKLSSKLPTSFVGVEVQYSLDGTLLAITGVDSTPPSSGTRVELHDAATWRMVARLPDAFVYAITAFASEPERLAVGGNGLMLWDVPGLKTGTPNITREWISCMAASRQTKRLAVATQEVVKVIDLDDSTKEIILHGNTGHFSRAMAYLFALAIGLVMLGALRVRGRRRDCQRCGRRYLKTRHSDPDSVCPDCRQRSLTAAEIAAAGIRKLSTRQSVGVLLVMLLMTPVIVAAFLGVTIVVFDNSAWLLIGPLAGVLLWQLLKFWLARARARFSLANESIRGEGRVERDGQLIVWSQGPEPRLPAIAEKLKACRRRLAEIVGDEIPDRLPLRVFYFDDPKAVNAHISRMFPRGPVKFPTVYLYGPLTRWISTCPQAARERLYDPDASLRMAMMMYLIHSYLGTLRPSWLIMGLSLSIAYDDSPTSVARLRNKIVALKATELLLSADRLFATRRQRLTASVVNPIAPGDYWYAAWFNSQAWSLIDFLAGADSTVEHRRDFGRFLRELAHMSRWQRMSRRRSTAEIMRRTLQRDLNELYSDWLQWAGTLQNSPPPAAPPDVAERIAAHVVPTIRDEAAARQDRIDAIRDLGNAGYITGAEALVGLLADPREDIRNEALWSLQMISGTTWSRHWGGQGDREVQSTEPSTEAQPAAKASS